MLTHSRVADGHNSPSAGTENQNTQYTAVVAWCLEIRLCSSTAVLSVRPWPNEAGASSTCAGRKDAAPTFYPFGPREQWLHVAKETEHTCSHPGDAEGTTLQQQLLPLFAGTNKTRSVQNNCITQH